jgi:hypothetical protein
MRYATAPFQQLDILDSGDSFRIGFRTSVLKLSIPGCISRMPAAESISTCCESGSISLRKNI